MISPRSASLSECCHLPSWHLLHPERRLLMHDSEHDLVPERNFATPEEDESLASLSTSAKPGRIKTFVTWRAVTLLAFAIILSAAGLIWKRDGNPPSDSLKRHQVIQIFVSDPNATVQLTAAYAGLGHNQMIENLYLSIIPPR